MIKPIRENSFNSDIIMVDGFGKSGKILMEKILECYEDVEIHIEEEYSQLVYKLYHNGDIKEEAAIYLLKTIFDRRMYNLLISREVNTRFKDDSSIFTYNNPLKYLKRYFSNDKNRDNFVEDANIKNKSFLVATQDALVYEDILFKTFGNRLKIIYVMRNPIEQIFDMRHYRFLERIGKSPSNTIITYKYKDKIVPLFSEGWEDEYLQKNNIYRLIRWDYEVYKKILYSLDSTPIEYKNNIKIVTLDSMVFHKDKVCNILGEFLNKRITSNINRVKPNAEFLRDRYSKFKYLIEEDNNNLELFNKLLELYGEIVNKYEILQ